MLLGDPSGCNLFGSGRAIARAAPRLLRTNLINGASRCDFESPTNNMRRALCGGSSSTMQSLVRDETVHSALELLEAAAGRTKIIVLCATCSLDRDADGSSERRVGK